MIPMTFADVGKEHIIRKVAEIPKYGLILKILDLFRVQQLPLLQPMEEI